ncbi:hypothetical protein [sulfur-oxidizing endosymbiont of Gigantopelta aegis]|uniref:hypothetical protein n=1 Tax=sulfur-oxidizing endosymbiont of Gigantopelta aegis TaxID=2794934 RepID=UPI001FEABB0B|nr:hypothetical protein [sulfur-oxidizing endosymbiont of Gigantopelta aegis]
MVVWGVMPIAFAITIPLLSSLEMEINKDHLWKLEQIHTRIDQQFDATQNLKSKSSRESLRAKIFKLKKQYKFDYLKLDISSTTIANSTSKTISKVFPKEIVVGQCLPNSSTYNHSSQHSISHKPSSDSVNFLLMICFPSIERAIELEHMKFGSLIVILPLFSACILFMSLEIPYTTLFKRSLMRHKALQKVICQRAWIFKVTTNSAIYHASLITW